MSLFEFEIVDYDPARCAEVVALWRQSFQRAMGLPEENDIEEVADQTAFFKTLKPDAIRLAVSSIDQKVLGFMVVQKNYLDHLYVSVDYQARGVGLKLLNIAKLQCPDGLSLHTFQRNTRAQGFYHAQGFTEIARGSASLTDNPWAIGLEDQQQWLADVTYVW